MFIFLGTSFYGQSYLDTIALKIKEAKSDSVKINVYYKASISTEKLKQGQLDSLFDLIIETGKKSNNRSMFAYALIQQAKWHHLRKEHGKALEKYFSALKESEKINYMYGRVIAHNRIGALYLDDKNNDLAIKQYYYSVPLALAINDSDDLSENYSSLGTAYTNKKIFDSSLLYHHKALDIRLKKASKKNLANTYNNIGLAYKGLKDYDKAIDFLSKALEVRLEINDKRGIAGAKINIGNVLNLKKEYNKALTYLQQGTDLAYETKYGDYYCNGLLGIKNSLVGLKRWEECCKVWDAYKEASDSVKAEKIKKDIMELETKYDSDRKDTDLKLKEEQIKFKTAQNSKQKTLIAASCVALLMSLLAVFFIYRSFRLNKRNAVQLAFKNHLIEEKNKQITDSINYARLIQQSLLASESMLDKNLMEYFILYKPKDIVSGDFYWASETKEGFLLACVDCTGHGVPGAFMSLIGKENLDKAIVKSNSPKQILSELNKGVKRSLNQNSQGNSNRDGMDAAIIRIEKGNNAVSKVYYSGANRPLWIVRKTTGALEEIKPTKQAIGGFTNDNQEFEEHELTLNAGDMIYMSTDGYADQFGSDKNKKLTTKRFKELLISFHASKAQEQKQELEGFFMDWKGKSEQLDDLLVIGIKA